MSLSWLHAFFLGALSLHAAELTAPPLARFSIENMDPRVEPGTDFYRYANGTWLKKNTIPADQVSWSPTEQLIQTNAIRLSEILAKASEADPSRNPIQRQVGDFYASAMDLERLEQLAFSPILADLKKIDALQSKADMAELLADFHQRGIGALFDLSVVADQRQSSVYALELNQGGLGLPDRDYYFGPRFASERAAYRKHITKMLQLLGESAQAAAQDADAILVVETGLAKASAKLEDLSDPVANYHKVPVTELLQWNPSFDWERFWKASAAAPFTTVLVGQPKFFKALEVALKTRPLTQWKSYLRWHLLSAMAPLLHRAPDEENFNFYNKTLEGQPEMNPRWKRATQQVDGSLGEALGKLYAERFFPDQARLRMDEMVKNITTVYREELGRVPWMSATTRAQAVEKFERFSTKIGTPKKYLDYSSIEIRRDDYLGNVQRAASFESKRHMARIGCAVDRDEWEMSTPTVNAYFNPSMNEIVFPAGILQPPFFDPEMDDAVNYGATGATIGHEMTHGYDNEGRKYDAEGNLRDWWSKADVREFHTRAQKLVAQFSKIEALPKVFINGKLTLAENIADLGGLSIAFTALERALEAEPAKRRLIDGFTPEQRFFLAYAQSWAVKDRDAHLRQSLTTDTHAPEMVRGFAPLLNLQAFYDAFHIPESAPLFRPKKDRAFIW